MYQITKKTDYSICVNHHLTEIQLIIRKEAEEIKFFECLGKPKKAKLVL